MAPIIHQVVGALLVVAGAILTPTPIPFGLIMLTIGFALLAPYFAPVRRVVRGIRRRWPKVDEALRRHRDRFPAIIRQTIDRTHPDLAPAE
ncbi:MAG: PGPGW domain-containing protein [Parvularculaceae bacterium]|nr:PGPGW domain-containing protein [Parvularculaceae bacterium]